MTAGKFRGSCVLVVEDDALIALLLQDMLTDLGCATVRLAGSPDQAFALIERDRFDAALLDVNLHGGKTSYAIADRLIERGAPFAFLTGYGEGGVDPAYRGVAVLTKPIDDSSLKAALEALVAPKEQ